MRNKIENWLLGDSEMILLEDIDPLLMSRLRGYGIFAALAIVATIVLAFLTGFVMIVAGMLVVLYFFGTMLFLYRAIQRREIAEMVCVITDVNANMLQKYKGHATLHLLASNDDKYIVSLPLSKSGQYQPQEFIRILYNSVDGIIGGAGERRIRTIYAIEHCDDAAIDAITEGATQKRR